MKSAKILLLVVSMVAVMLLTTSVAFCQQQITVEEANSWYEQDPEGFYNAVSSGEVIVVPEAESNTRYAILWKIVKDDNNCLISGATVTVDVPAGASVLLKLIPLTWGSSKSESTILGLAVFFIKWDRTPPPSITVTVTVSKSGYETITEDVTIYGSECLYQFNCVDNTLRHPPVSTPEFPLGLPILTSTVMGIYLFASRRRKK